MSLQIPDLDSSHSSVLPGTSTKKELAPILPILRANLLLGQTCLLFARWASTQTSTLRLKSGETDPSMNVYEYIRKYLACRSDVQLLQSRLTCPPLLGQLGAMKETMSVRAAEAENQRSVRAVLKTDLHAHSSYEVLNERSPYLATTSSALSSTWQPH